MQLRVDLGALPLGEGVSEVCAELDMPAWELAADGGEDYELCFCVAPSERVHVEEAVNAARGEAGGVGVTWIGRVVEGPPGVVLLDERGQDLRIEGFEHLL